MLKQGSGGGGGLAVREASANFFFDVWLVLDLWAIYGLFNAVNENSSFYFNYLGISCWYEIRGLFISSLGTQQMTPPKYP